MAGVKGRSGRHNRPPAHFETVRQIINGSQIAKALQDHVVGDKKMIPSQITAGLGLLRKVIPDLSQVSGDAEAPIRHVLTWASEQKKPDA